jgi:hypothetical protein
VHDNERHDCQIHRGAAGVDFTAEAAEKPTMRAAANAVIAEASLPSPYRFSMKPR